MYSCILAVLFILRIVKRSHLFAPKYVESHCGISAKKTLRQLEVISKKLVKSEADIEFLQACLIYQLSPKFVRFKLHKKERQNWRRVKALKKQLILSEIREHRKKIIKFKKGKEKLQGFLF